MHASYASVKVENRESVIVRPKDGGNFRSLRVVMLVPDRYTVVSVQRSEPALRARDLDDLCAGGGRRHPIRGIVPPVRVPFIAVEAKNPRGHASVRVERRKFVPSRMKRLHFLSNGRARRPVGDRLAVCVVSAVDGTPRAHASITMQRSPPFNGPDDNSHLLAGCRSADAVGHDADVVSAAPEANAAIGVDPCRCSSVRRNRHNVVSCRRELVHVAGYANTAVPVQNGEAHSIKGMHGVHIVDDMYASGIMRLPPRL